MKCDICGHEETGFPNLPTELEAMADHLADAHGLDDWERWPDGSVVVEDTTLEPSDFTRDDA